MKYQKKFVAPRVEDPKVSKALHSIDKEFSMVAAAVNDHASLARGYIGSGAPAAGLGSDGDLYLDTTGSVLYGPKTAGAWGVGIAIPLSAGTAGQYWRGDKTWQTLNQAAVAGLTTADGPTFDHVHTPAISGRSVILADDAAYSFTLQGAIAVIFVACYNSASSGIVHANPSTPATTKFCGGALVNVTTGPLTGTTGTDGRFTVSCHTDGKVYLENRLGGGVTWAVSVFTL